MKTSLVLVLAVFTTLNAYAVDFNAIIDENSKAQNELSAQIKADVNESQQAAYDATKNYIKDDVKIVNVKTDRNFLKFAKEKKQYKASTEKTEKRLAQEFKDLE